MGLLPFLGMILGTVNNRVIVWKWVCASSGGRLEAVCSHNTSIIALYLQAMGRRIFVGDLMRSALLLTYNPEEPALEEVAHDPGTAWLTAIAMLTEDICFCTDDAYNVFALSRGANKPI